MRKCPDYLISCPPPSPSLTAELLVTHQQSARRVFPADGLALDIRIHHAAYFIYGHASMLIEESQVDLEEDFLFFSFTANR